MSRVTKRNILVVIILICFFAACSPQVQYNVLSFVFDGVPNPNIDTTAQNDTIAKIDSNSLANKSLTPQVNYHPPFQSNECENCHITSSMGKYTMNQPELCYQCHENFEEKYAYVHGPVSGGYCTQCHSPHQSTNKFLLARTGQDLCFRCHEKQQVLRNENHTDIGQTNCTECHNPHGGADRFILN